jgi:hypothetical protein
VSISAASAAVIPFCVVRVPSEPSINIATDPENAAPQSPVFQGKSSPICAALPPDASVVTQWGNVGYRISRGVTH